MHYATNQLASITVSRDVLGLAVVRMSMGMAGLRCPVVGFANVLCGKPKPIQPCV